MSRSKELNHLVHLKDEINELKSRILRHKFISFHKLLPEENVPEPIGYDDIEKCA